jgi:hypothetical protein
MPAAGTYADDGEARSQKTPNPEGSLIYYREDVHMTVADAHAMTDALERACIAPALGGVEDDPGKVAAGSFER